MKLLVTNDDGIDSVFLHELVASLQRAGHELFIVAPASEQSWKGASKTRDRAVKSLAIDRGFGCPSWTVDGTPSDCVNIALEHLIDGEVDGVVSGINEGFNCSIGFVIASGTVAGAWEGALHGLPAIAVSQDVSEAVYVNLKEEGGKPNEELLSSIKMAADHTARLAGELLPQTARNSFTIHNVNFPYPCLPESIVKRTVPATMLMPGFFTAADANGMHKLLWTEANDISPHEPLTDVRCVSEKHISHSILDYRKLGYA
ncbi:MAG: 5'/3'-nucleotidase SurE [Opitutaceae bacterium]|nr:5'/3'-nucleotidase SurE [Opitutaceae bacterium]